MKIYSLLLFFKRASLISITLFFLSFIICAFFEMVFDTMVLLTLPFALFTFIFYSAVCFIEEFYAKEKCVVKNKRNVIHIYKYGGYNNEFIKNESFEDFEKSSAC